MRGKLCYSSNSQILIISRFFYLIFVWFLWIFIFLDNDDHDHQLCPKLSYSTTPPNTKKLIFGPLPKLIFGPLPVELIFPLCQNTYLASFFYCVHFIGLVVKWKVHNGGFISKNLTYIFKNYYVFILIIWC